MQEAAPAKRLHPLLTVAAISLTVFSAVGVAALTGVLPHSIGSSKESTPPALAVASEAPAPVSASQPAAVEPSAMPPAAPASTPYSKPAHRKAAKAKPSQPVQVAEAAAVPPPPPAPVVEAPRPIPGALGTVASVRQVTETPKTNGSGPILGGIVGAVAGHQVGQGKGNLLATVVGAAGGALGGLAVEDKVRETKHWEVVVRLDDGSIRTMKSDLQPFWHGGERVRLLDGKLQPAS